MFSHCSLLITHYSSLIISMPSRLTDNISSTYVEAANALRGKKARRRIVAYVESYEDIYFWRTVLGCLENEQRFFEVMLPSKQNLLRGKKSVLMNFAEGQVGPDMIACVDADYDYLLQGATRQSAIVVNSPYVFHTYVYAIENYQCYAPSLHDVCVSVSLNDHRIFDFQEWFRMYSEACYPLFVWSVWAYRTGHYNQFSMSDFNNVVVPGGFNVKQPADAIGHVRHKVNIKVNELQRIFPNQGKAITRLKEQMSALGVTPDTTYLYMQGHHLFDAVVAPIVSKVCTLLQQERQREISRANAPGTQKRNELACYDNAREDIKSMLKKNAGYHFCPRFRQLQEDVEKYLNAPA